MVIAREGKRDGTSVPVPVLSRDRILICGPVPTLSRDNISICVPVPVLSRDKNSNVVPVPQLSRDGPRVPSRDSKSPGFFLVYYETEIAQTPRK